MSDTNPSPHREEPATVDELAARRAAKLGNPEPQDDTDDSEAYADSSFDDDFDDLYDEPYEDDLTSRRSAAASAYDPDALDTDPDVEPVVADLDGDYLDDIDDDYR